MANIRKVWQKFFVDAPLLYPEDIFYIASLKYQANLSSSSDDPK